MKRKVYLKGELDHVALTRVPVNARTAFTQVTEKSMMTTKLSDGVSIVGEDFREDVEDLAEAERTHKSEVDDDLVIKSDEDESQAVEEHREQEIILRALLEDEGYEPEAIEKAQWDYAYKKSLPDSAYAYVEKGCEKVDGKTPQSCRHLPYKDKSGSIDCVHVRAALQAVGGARTGKKMSVPSGVVQKLRRALKSCQKSKAEVLDVELTEYEQGRIDGANAMIDLDASDDEVNETMADETEKKDKAEVESPEPVSVDLDAILKALKASMPEEEPEEKAEVQPPDEFDVHTNLLRQIVAAEGAGRAKKLEVAEAVLRSYAAHVGKTINETTPASPEDVANSVKGQLEEALRPMMDKIAVLEEAVLGGRPEAPESKALSFAVSPLETRKAAVGPQEKFAIDPLTSFLEAQKGGSTEKSRIRQLARESSGLPSDVL